MSGRLTSIIEPIAVSLGLVWLAAITSVTVFLIAKVLINVVL